MSRITFAVTAVALAMLSATLGLIQVETILCQTGGDLGGGLVGEESADPAGEQPHDGDVARRFIVDGVPKCTERLPLGGTESRFARHAPERNGNRRQFRLTLSVCVRSESPAEGVERVVVAVTDVDRLLVGAARPGV